jgi:hypothetical protein
MFRVVRHQGYVEHERMRRYQRIEATDRRTLTDERLSNRSEPSRYSLVDRDNRHGSSKGVDEPMQLPGAAMISAVS